MVSVMTNGVILHKTNVWKSSGMVRDGDQGARVCVTPLLRPGGGRPQSIGPDWAQGGPAQSPKANEATHTPGECLVPRPHPTKDQNIPDCQQIDNIGQNIWTCSQTNIAD